MKDPMRLFDDPALAPEERDLLAEGIPMPQASAADRKRVGSFVAGITAGTLAGGTLLWAKVGLAALAIGGAGVAAWAVTGPWGESVEEPRPEMVVPPSESEVEVEAEAEAEAETETEAEAETEAETGTEVETERAERRPVEPEAAGDSLAEEVAMLERARALLATNPAQALAEAERSRRLYRNGQLRDERELITITALFRLGRARQAERRAQALINRNPNGMYARRARRLMEAQ